MKKEWWKLVSVRKMAVVAGILFVVSLLPLILLGRYNVMCYDDYLFGSTVRDTFISTGSVKQAIMEGVAIANDRYMQWQGCWIVTFLTAIYPANFIYQAAFIVPVISILLFAASTFLMGRQLFTKWLGGDGAEADLVMFVLLFLFYQVMDSPFEGLYWYNGVMAYIVPQSFLFLTVAAITKALWSEKRGSKTGWCIAACFAAALAVGGNYITALQAELVLLLLTAYAWFKERRKLAAAFIPCLVGTVCFLLNVLAPGNALRSAADGVAGCNPVTAILLSFYNAVLYMIEWTPAIVLLVWIALLPVMWRIAGKAERTFKYPVLVMLGAYCLLSAMFTPTLYAMGTVGLPRTNNIIQMVYYLCLFGVTTYWLGWIRHRKKRDVLSAELFSERTGWAFTAAVMLLVLGVWFFTMDKNTYTSVSALRSLVKGEGAVFYEESMERYALYVDESVQDVVVRPFSERPALFDFMDLTEEPGNWLNMAVRAYFHKNSVVLEASTE